MCVCVCACVCVRAYEICCSFSLVEFIQTMSLHSFKYLICLSVCLFQLNKFFELLFHLSFCHRAIRKIAERNSCHMCMTHSFCMSKKMENVLSKKRFAFNACLVCILKGSPNMPAIFSVVSLGTSSRNITGQRHNIGKHLRSQLDPISHKLFILVIVSILYIYIYSVYTSGM